MQGEIDMPTWFRIRITLVAMFIFLGIAMMIGAHRSNAPEALRALPWLLGATVIVIYIAAPKRGP